METPTKRPSKVYQIYYPGIGWVVQSAKAHRRMLANIERRRKLGKA